MTMNRELESRLWVIIWVDGRHCLGVTITLPLIYIYIVVCIIQNQSLPPDLQEQVFNVGFFLRKLPLWVPPQWQVSLRLCCLCLDHEFSVRASCRRWYQTLQLHQPGKGSRKKSKYFTVRLTVRVDPTPPPLRSVFCDFFQGVHLTLDYGNMYSETDFTPEIQYMIYWQGKRVRTNEHWALWGPVKFQLVIMKRAWKMHFSAPS